nr:hypothetical protein GCM10020093_061980 [Planobispora longispora]
MGLRPGGRQGAPRDAPAVRVGPADPLDQAQPGDLLFWRHDPTNPGYVSHVAIYWGGGKMLHAPRTGDVVKLVPVTTRNFAGAVRVSPQIAVRVR